jgi:hypothetical protein
MASSTVVSRRKFLKGIGLSGAAVRIGIPALDAMFNDSGTAYAAGAANRLAEKKIESKFVLWFNGNGIVERYWIPLETGSDYRITPCLKPLAPFKNDVHIITGVDSPSARKPGPGNDHHRSMSALMSGESFTGRGAGGRLIGRKWGAGERFHRFILKQ